jgi:hypothetical protein
MAAGFIEDEVSAWHNRRNSESGQADFLYEIGALGKAEMNKAPADYTGEKLRLQMQGNVEAAAQAVAAGPGKHTAEQVRTLSRYQRLAPYIYEVIQDKAKQGDSMLTPLYNRHKAIMNFLETTELEKNKQKLIRNVRAQGLGR